MNMSIEHTLYGGPLDGLEVSFSETLDDGDEFEVPVDYMTVVPTTESSLPSSVSTIKPSGVAAVYVFVEGELRYLSTKTYKVTKSIP